ncbi:Uncharacterised protein [Starkeya nomas]|uniref:diguanylate cyclase n=1 Tax=Starkeya nomas TaxID=2666134 RepID=A0A5S9NDU4_9HYPH|nr:sensor domain-containing diguanylate cyclase [Starkeya nomas]CAA0088307.1 Uncharacterised protein [Starkeya nomas]
MSSDALPSNDAARVQSEAALAEAPVALCVVSDDLRLLAVNMQMAALLGRPAQEIVGHPVDDFLPGSSALVRRWFERVAAGRAVSEQEWSDPASGRTYLASARAVPDVEGKSASLSIALTDITRRRLLRAGLAQRERRIGVALESAGQWVWELDIRSGVVRRSPRWKMALGFGPDDTPEENERTPWSIIHPDDRPMVVQRYEQVLAGSSDIFEAVYRVPDKFGRWRWILGRGRIVERDAEGRPLRLLATSVDITRQKQIEEELAATVRQRERLERELIEANRRLTELSEMDPLTELPNRRKFDKVLAHEIKRSGRHKPSLALMMIDVDDFKTYNDLYGHIEGDECLRRIAEALRGCARRAGDLVTRYGGEEFAAILADTDESDAIAVATHMLRAVRALRLPHAGTPQGIVTVSIGITLYDANTPPLPSPGLIAGADRALYAAKQAGRNRILVLGADGSMSPVPVTDGVPPAPDGTAAPGSTARR